MVPFRQLDGVFAVRKDTSVHLWPYCEHSWDSSKSFAAGGSKLALGLVSRSKPRKLTVESHRTAETEPLNLFTRAASSVADVLHDVSIARCSRRQIHRASRQFLAAQNS
jgi:hypothetical protein